MKIKAVEAKHHVYTSGHNLAVSCSLMFHEAALFQNTFCTFLPKYLNILPFFVL